MLKNKKKSKLSGDRTSNGIVITDSISLKINSTSSVLPKVFLILTAFAGVLGFTASIITLFRLECDTEKLALALTAEFILFSIIFMFTSKAKYLLIPVYILTAYGIYRTTDDFINGYGVFVNSIMQNLNIVKEGYSYYVIKETVDQEYCLTLFLFFLLTVINSILCYNTILKPRFVFDFCSTFPFIEIGLYFGYSPSHKPFFLLISYWIAVFAMRAAGNQYHSNSGQPVFIRKNNMFISSGNLRNNVIEKIGVITLVSSLAVLLTSEAFLNTISYERPDKVKQKRYDIMSAVSELSVENVIDALSKNAKKNPSNGKSSLGNLDQISFENKTDLTIMLSGNIYSNLYIKGFTGGLYKDNTWWEIPESVYKKNSGLFSEMNKRDLHSQDFLYRNNIILKQYYPEYFKERHAIVTTSFSLNKYMFTPYGIKASNENKYINDYGLTTSDNKNYDFDFITTPDLYKDLTPVYENMSRLSDSEVYKSTELEYRNFVYSNYLDIPDSDDLRKLREMFSYLPEYNGSNLQEISDTIRTILHSSASYTLRPGKTPEGRDMAYYMITESHKGYCSYFATAAILLARMTGIPARYSEGYVIVPDDLKRSEKVNSYYKVQIKDTRSHAWAEFYIDGYGWVPFEYTPGYDNGIISTENPDSPELTRKVNAVTEPVTVTDVSVTVTVMQDTQTLPTTTVPVTQHRPEVSVTSTAVPSYGDSGTDGNGGNGNPSEKKSALSPAVTVFLALLLIIAAAFFILNFVHENIVDKRNKSFRGKSNRKNISNIYDYVCQLLSSYGISKGNMLPLEFAEYAEENAQSIAEPGEITDLINIVLKSGYSPDEPSDDDVKYAIHTAKKLAKKIYDSKEKSEKIRFRLIHHLIK